jgi:hypothetical protein
MILRAPSFGSATHPEFYTACLDECAWADVHGLETHQDADVDQWLPKATIAAA